MLGYFSISCGDFTIGIGRRDQHDAGRIDAVQKRRKTLIDLINVFVVIEMVLFDIEDNADARLTPGIVEAAVRFAGFDDEEIAAAVSGGTRRVGEQMSDHGKKGQLPRREQYAWAVMAVVVDLP